MTDSTPPPPPPPPQPPGGGWGGPPRGGGWGGPPQGTSGLAPNVASGLAYVLTFVTGVLFFMLDRRPEVRFHAMQSILFGLAWLVVSVLRQVVGFFPLDILLFLLYLGGLVAWVVLMVQAFQGNHFKLPYIGDLAEQQARNTP